MSTGDLYFPSPGKAAQAARVAVNNCAFSLQDVSPSPDTIKFSKHPRRPNAVEVIEVDAVELAVLLGSVVADVVPVLEPEVVAVPVWVLDADDVGVLENDEDEELVTVLATVVDPVVDTDE